MTGDGVLQEGEITQRKVICQTDNIQALSNVEQVDPGCICEFGGVEPKQVWMMALLER